MTSKAANIFEISYDWVIENGGRENYQSIVHSELLRLFDNPEQMAEHVQLLRPNSRLIYLTPQAIDLLVDHPLTSHLKEALESEIFYEYDAIEYVHIHIFDIVSEVKKRAGARVRIQSAKSSSDIICLTSGLILASFKKGQFVKVTKTKYRDAIIDAIQFIEYIYKHRTSEVLFRPMKELLEESLPRRLGNLKWEPDPIMTDSPLAGQDTVLETTRNNILETLEIVRDELLSKVGY